MSDFRYVGSELDLFAKVHNWKRYWSQRVQPFIAGDILEVGAGTGSNTGFLDRGRRGRWLCLEPDSQLAGQLTRNLSPAMAHNAYEVVCGALQCLPAEDRFDTIIYIDVLEHIENDRAELMNAASHLRPGGRIIVLAPAHQWLFTPFDAAIGHFRRYNRSMLRDVSPGGMALDQLIYLDSVGLAASLANLLFLRQSMPKPAQLQLWDRKLIPASRIVDRVLGYAVGKSILAV